MAPFLLKSGFRFLLPKVLLLAFAGMILSYSNEKVSVDALFSLNKTERFFSISEQSVYLMERNLDIASFYTSIKEKGTKAEDYLVYATIEYFKPTNKNDLQRKLKLAKLFLDSARKLGDHQLMAKFSYDVSVFSYESGYYNQAFEYKLYCLDDLQKDPTGKYFDQAWILHQIANDYYLFGDYPTAIRLSKAACNASRTHTPNWKWFSMTAPNLTGMAHLKNGELDSAQVWLQQSFNVAKQFDDLSWMGITTGNMGHVKFQQNKIKEAIVLYEKALDWCRQARLWDNISAFCSNLAQCYIKTGNYEKAGILLNEAADASEKAVVLPGYVATPNKVKFFSVSEQYYRAIGNAGKALQCADSLRKYESLQQVSFDKNKKIQSEAQLAYRNKELENQVLKQDQAFDRLLLVGLGATIILLLTIGVLYTKRQRLMHELKKEKLEREKVKAEEELNRAQQELKGITSSMMEKNRLLEAYISEVNRLKAETDTIAQQQLESLEKLKELTVLTDEEWNHFRSVFDKVHPGYQGRLRNKYPELTPAEFRFMVFTRLNITPKEMTAMLGVSTETIRGIRFRLKKKLSLEDGSEIERLAHEI